MDDTSSVDYRQSFDVRVAKVWLAPLPMMFRFGVSAGGIMDQTMKWGGLWRRIFEEVVVRS